MKKYIYLFLVSLFVSNIALAQVDRSKQPKPGPAPKINLTDPQTFKLDNGLTVLVVENHKLPTVRIQLLIDNPMHASGPKAGVESLFASLMGNGTTNISKDDFNEEVDYMGASISFGDDYAFAFGLSEFTPRLIELMADAIKNPLFTEEEFEKERAKLIEGLRMGERNVSDVARRVQSALLYGSSHPKGEFTTIEKVEGLSLNDVTSFYNQFFNPENAYLVVVGDVKFASIKEQVTNQLKDWTSSYSPSVSYSDPKDVQYTQINFIDMPNAVQSEIAVMNLVKLKMSDPDYFPVLVANEILGGGFNSYLNMTLREKHGWTYGARSHTGADKEITRFIATTQVRNAVTDSAVVEMLNEIKNIRENKVSIAQLNTVKAKFTGNFVMALERPETVANYALRIRTQNLDDNFYLNFLKKIEAVTADDVMRVAKKYYQPNNLRIVIVGKGADVLEGLKNIKGLNGKIIPVQYFDRFANPTEEPEFNKPVTDGVTAKDVADKYIQAIGGRKAVENIKSIKVDATAEVQGMQLSMETVNTSKGQSYMNLAMGGMSMQKVVFDGEKGFQIAQGQRIENTPEQNASAKLEAQPFKELNAENAKLLREDNVDGKAAYVLSFGGDSEYFYDKATGLLLKQETTLEAMGQTIQSVVSYSDYRAVEGVKIPYSLEQSVGPQTIKVTVKDVEVNGAISEDLFK